MRVRSVLKGGAVVAAAGAAGYAAAHLVARRAMRRPDPHAGHPFRPRAEVEHEVESFDGARIHVVEFGRGRPIVLAHGVTNDHRVWTHQIDDLVALGHRVIALDHRGHGRSTVGSEGFGVERLAHDVKAVLETLDLRDAVLVGHSMGGMALQGFACAHPEVARERVAGLVLVGTTPHALRHWRSLDRLPEESAVSEAVFDWLMNHPAFGYLATRTVFGRRPHASHVDVTRTMVVECPPATRRAAPRALLDCDLRERICDVGLPVLVVTGTHDTLAPAAAGRLIAELVPQARLEVLRGAGHMLMLERADDVTRLIASFAAEAWGIPEPSLDGPGAAGGSPRSGAGSPDGSRGSTVTTATSAAPSAGAP